MKKFGSLIFIILIISSTFLFAACGNENLSIDSIKSKFKDEDYTIYSLSGNDLSDVAGLIAGFIATKGTLSGTVEDTNYINVKVYNFDNQEYTEEYRDLAGINKVFSLQGKVYLCIVSHSIGDNEGNLTHVTDSAKIQAALDIFNSFF